MDPTAPLAWQPNPDAWILVVALGGGYLYALAAWGPRFARGRRAATGRQRSWFFAGLAVLWVAADYPLHGLSDTLFSAHMLQHLLFSFVAVPMMMLGTPGWLFRRLLSPAPVKLVWRVITKPLPALLVFNFWIALYHWPAFVNASVANDLVHFAVHVAWVGTAVVMWWPVLSPLPELPHLSYPGRMLYLFGQSIVPTVPASFLTLGDSVLYASYRTTTMPFGLDPLVDQQMAGLIMKVGGGFLIWGIIMVLFFRWSAEQESGGPDHLYWRDLEPELEPRELARPRRG